ncbi:MAG: hypothetical protein AAGM84_04650 [Pseudomonadota bacterium]
MRLFFALALLSLGSAAFGQQVSPIAQLCDDRPRADAIFEPWEANTRTFANGAVRLALIDTVEPAAAWAHLLILSPPYDELGLRQCILVNNGGMGFSAMQFEALEASYDPARGLIFTLPAGVYLDGGPGDPVFDLEIVLNQSTGRVDARVLGQR